MNPDNVRIAVIGLGYVGLPLAVEFGRHFPTMGFNLKQARFAKLRNGPAMPQSSRFELPHARLRSLCHQEPIM